MTKIKMSLSESSIDEVIKQIRDIQDKLKNDNDLFVEKLAEVGIKVINMEMQDVKLTVTDFNTLSEEQEDWDYNIQNVVDSSGTTSSMQILVSGDKLLFIEFGAGVTYAEQQNPKANEMGYGVGTYPGQTHAFDPEGWYYRDSGTEEWKHSFGNRAYMPVYKSSVEMRDKIVEIAKEVFGS